MTERTRDEKSLAQDLQGAFFCLVGGFFAVSIVLFLRGQEPVGGLLSRLTVPVVELVAWFGPMAALLLSAGLASLGALLFLRPASLPAGRPLGTLLAISVGFALVLGAFGRGGAVGAYLPGLLPGFAGQAVVLLLGLALGWLGWTFLPSSRSIPASTGEALQRMSLAGRRDAAAGVSPAEAALLVTEAHIAREKAALRETIRPLAAAPPAARSSPARPLASPAVAPAPAPSSSMASVEEDESRQEAPPTPAWEVHDDVAAEGEAQEGRVPSEVLAAPEAEATDAADDEALASIVEQGFELEPGEGEDEAVEAAPAAAAGPAASEPAWEQIGLFDEFDEAAAEPAVPAPARDPTPELDFGGEPVRSHEPEPAPSASAVEAGAPFVLPAAPPTSTAASRRAQPTRRETTRREATPAPEKGAEGWDQLVFEAGCAILEQNRVAVSMLERSFGLDFDQACRVLDELQTAGLIGPYMGGRSRDILLTREEWLAHAPHAS
jgi:hypothetical protein